MTKQLLSASSIRSPLRTLYRARAAAATLLAVALLLSAIGGLPIALADTTPPPPPYVPVYTMDIIGDSGSGFTDSGGLAINNSGEATGWNYGASHNPVQEAFRSSGTTATGLGVLSGGSSVGWAINASGMVAGSSGDLANYTDPYRAVTWTGTTIQDISGGVNSEASGINDAGDVVGYTEASPGSLTAFLVPNAGSITDLNTLVTSNPANLTLNFGWDINTSGQVTGFGQTGSGPLRAFRFAPDGTVASLGVIGAHPSDGTVGTALNDDGYVVGYQFGGLNHAFQWDGSSMQDLGTVSGYPNAEASGINTDAWIVGDVWKGSGATFVSHAFVRAPGGTLVDLNTRVKLLAGYTLEAAYGINDAGQIVGTGFGNNREFAFVLTPSNISRVAGASRYDTAAKISAANYVPDQPTVYIATGQNFPDALAGAALAGRDGAPLILVPTTGTLPAVVTTELQRLNPTTIVIFGGTGAVSESIRSQIQSAVPFAVISRIAGASRYDTAAQISLLNYASAQPKVYVATGQNFPDALAGAALAGRDGAPLILVPTTGTVPAVVVAELQRLAPTQIVIFGGTGAVSASISSQIQTAVPGATVSRVSGASRYATAALISAGSYTAGQAKVYVSTGQNFPDALAGAALAGRDGAPLILVPTTGTLPAVVVTELQRLAPTSIVIFGGTGAVSTSIELSIAGL